MEVKDLGGRAERCVDFLLAPNVERAFGPLYWIVGNNTVGIFGGKKSAALRGHIAADIVERVTSDFFENRRASDLKRLEIGDGELGLVVEHFFEMGHVPVSVHGIAMKSASEMIVHPASRHFAQGEEVHLQGVFAALGLRISRVNTREKIQRYRARKFWGDAEPAFVRVVTARDLLISGVESFAAELRAGISHPGDSRFSQRGGDFR